MSTPRSKRGQGPGRNPNLDADKNRRQDRGHDRRPERHREPGDRYVPNRDGDETHQARRARSRSRSPTLIPRHRVRSRSPIPRHVRDRSNDGQDRAGRQGRQGRQNVSFGEPERLVATENQEDLDDGLRIPDRDEALDSVERAAGRLSGYNLFDQTRQAQTPHSPLGATTRTEPDGWNHNGDWVSGNLQGNINEPSNHGENMSGDDHFSNSAQYRAQDPRVRTPHPSSQQDLSAVQKAIENSNLALYRSSNRGNSVIGYEEICEGDDRKPKLIDSRKVQVGDIVEINETDITSDSNARLGDGKTIPSSAGLQSSKRCRIVVTGGSHERRTGFRITSCNNNMLNKLQNMGSGNLVRYFLICPQGGPMPPNPTNLSLLRILSSEFWLGVSVMDTENVITTLPDENTRYFGRANIEDLSRAVDEKAKRESAKLSALTDALRGVNPYGSEERHAALSGYSSNNPGRSTVQQHITPRFNAPAAMRPTSNAGPAIRRSPGRQQNALAPRARHNPETQPVLPQHQFAPQHDQNQRPRNGTGNRAPAQQRAELDGPRRGAAPVPRDSGYNSAKNGPAPSSSPRSGS